MYINIKRYVERLPLTFRRICQLSFEAAYGRSVFLTVLSSFAVFLGLLTVHVHVIVP